MSEPELDRVCQNDALLPSPTLVVVVPHPDDETLGFSGPIFATTASGGRVRVVVVTDGQAYCGACRVWKNGAPRDVGHSLEPCTVRELVVFGHVRRRETLNAMEILGVSDADVSFLGYVDGSLDAAWWSRDRPPPLPECVDGGELPEIWRDKTGDRLLQELTAILQQEEDARLVFTTDPRDTHPDHVALFDFVEASLQRAGGERSLVTSLIHRSWTDTCSEAATGEGRCALPLPDEPDAEAPRFSEFRETSYRPHTWWEAREEEYGEPLRFCLQPELYDGSEALKRRAIDRYETQIGVRDRFGELLPPAHQGRVDWSGWLLRFVRRDELFYLADRLERPSSPARGGPIP